MRQVRSAHRPVRCPAGRCGPAGVRVARRDRALRAVRARHEQLPAPLAELGDRIEVRTSPAPGGKGTELAVRLRDSSSSGTALSRLSGSDPQADLRSRLRRAKQLLEVGEVLAVDPAPHGRRTATPGGVLLEAWTRVAPKAGVR